MNPTTTTLAWFVVSVWILTCVWGLDRRSQDAKAVGRANGQSDSHGPKGHDSEPAAGNTRFAFDLYHHLSGQDDNRLYSPYSISQALAMTFAGARSQTERQMAGTLHFGIDHAKLHAGFKDL